MKKVKLRLKQVIKESGKASLTVYVVLRALVIVCMISEILNGHIENALLCVLALILFLVPAFVEQTFKIELPSILEIMVFLFIFASAILGEINNFYGLFKNFDTILHTINGFLAASVGFSLVYLLNQNVESFKLSPFFVSLVAFCFSMTIGIVWEFYEYGMDNLFNRDMQKDKIVYKVNSVALNEDGLNVPVTLKPSYTVIYDNNNEEIIRFNGYLDIGLKDTMKDLLVNFLGAVTYCIFGYLYIVNEDKYKMAGRYLIKKKN